MPDLVVAALEQLGFTSTDAKVYLGLVQAHPATGYELSKRTQVPRSAMYAVLARLERAGLVRNVGANPARYEPLPPQQLVARLKDQHQQSLAELQRAMERMDNMPPPPSLWAVTGRDAILEEADRQVRASNTVVAASLWQREALVLAPALEDARSRGVEVVLFSFTPLPDLGPRVFSYGIPQAELERYWPHKLIVVSDKQRVLVGGDARATVTNETALVEMALSTLVLDLTLLGQRLGVETGGAVGLLTQHLAPLEHLLEAARRR